MRIIKGRHTGCYLAQDTASIIPLAILKYVLFVFCCIFVEISEALVTTDTPPQGVRALALVFGITTPIRSAYDSEGNLRSLVEPLNQSISLETLASKKPELLDLRQTLNSLSPNRYGDNLISANLYGNVSVQERRYVLGFLWGYKDYLAVGFSIPIIERRTEVSFKADVVDNSASILKSVGNLPRVSDGLKALRDYHVSTQSFEEEIFTNRGYETPHNQSLTAMGEMDLQARYRIFQGPSQTIGMRTVLKLPSSTHYADISNPIDRDIGDGSYALQQSAIYSQKIFDRVLSFHSAVGGKYHFEQKKQMVVPRQSSVSGELPDIKNDPYQVEMAYRQLGPEVSFDNALAVDMWGGILRFSTSYIYEHKWTDHYWGSRTLNYGLLEQNSASSGHSIELAIETSSIPLFLDQKAMAPAGLAIRWNQPVGGRNIPYSPYGRIDLIALF